jgi:pimeloyl-ACP methyl ester carboxylesterase
MKSFESWDQTEIAYQAWGERTLTPPVVLHHGFVVDANSNWVAAIRPKVLSDAIPGATLRILSGDHIGAIADPRFKQSIVDFLALTPE